MWSIGVIIYILLGGYPPFQDENQTRLFRKIKRGNFKFHNEYWGHVSSEAKDLIRKLLTVDPKKRLTAGGAVSHPWLLSKDVDLLSHNLDKNLQKLVLFNAQRKLRAAVKSVRTNPLHRGGKGRSRIEGCLCKIEACLSKEMGGLFKIQKYGFEEIVPV
ncbi:unnamed protein product [Choristocarpus tenellus]